MRKAMKRALCGGVAAGMLAGAGAVPAMAAEGPTYRVKLVSFRAADESGWDRLGSDEVYWVMSSVGANGTGTTYRTRTFGDVDSGETRAFGVDEGCVFPKTCGSAVAPAGIGVSIQLLERDAGDAAAVVAKAREYFDKVGAIGDWADPTTWLAKAMGYMGQAAGYIGQWLGDDLLGNRTFTYTRDRLAQRLPAAGRSFTETRYFGGLSTSGGADYYLTLRVTRVR